MNQHHIDDELALEEFGRLRSHADAVIEGLRDTGITPDDAVFVLMLALSSFVAALPEEHRQTLLKRITDVLADMVPQGGHDSRPRYDA